MDSPNARNLISSLRVKSLTAGIFSFLAVPITKYLSSDAGSELERVSKGASYPNLRNFSTLPRQSDDSE
jgi:hypothetical protein